MANTGDRFERAVSIMARLRAPGGCPWDREQTFDTIKPFTLEETYEVIEAIDNRDWDELKGELGDLLLQILFYSEMAQEEGHFSIDDVLDRLSAKLINRHPHVFGDVKADTSSEVVKNWEAIKAEEKRLRQNANGKQSKEAPKSILGGVSRNMPALMEALKISSKVAQVGFEWPEIGGLFEKLTEETNELRENLAEIPPPGPQPPNRGVASSGKQAIPEALREKLEDEVGDLFFVVVNIARYLSIDPESALRKTNVKFRRRFQWLEERLQRTGKRAEPIEPGRDGIALAGCETGGAPVSVAPTSVSPEIVIRDCNGLEELEACVQLQKEVWGFNDIDIVPARVFLVASKIGGQVIGAFRGDELIGYALSIPGNRNGRVYLHSHMLAVKESCRNLGLGRKLKLAQRDDALEKGIGLIEWTFDPLEIKNAYLNIVKLGAIARRYNINQYGSFSSPLQGGLPTDRLVAEWWLRSDRVEAVLANQDPRPFITKESIAVPTEIYAWKRDADDRMKAAELQICNREKFLGAFSKGLVILDYQRDERGNGAFLLGHWDETWSYART